MDLPDYGHLISKYGPFANIVGVALALTATFSLLLLKSVGKVSKWTWLAAYTPPFVVALPARVLSFALMAVAYITMTRSNYQWFGAVAILTGILTVVVVAWFDRVRRIYIDSIELVGADGKQLVDKKGKLLFENVVVGTESKLRPEAAQAFAEARKTRGISLREFMKGYGSPKVNDPGSLWDREYLGKIGGNLALLLMFIVLFPVLTLFLAAFIVDTHIRLPADGNTPGASRSAEDGPTAPGKSD